MLLVEAMLVEAILVEAMFELRRKMQLQSLYAVILFEYVLLTNIWGIYEGSSSHFSFCPRLSLIAVVRLLSYVLLN